VEVIRELDKKFPIYFYIIYTTITSPTLNYKLKNLELFKRKNLILELI